jgi:hypothetical protein
MGSGANEKVIFGAFDNSANDGVEVQGSVDIFDQFSHYLGFYSRDRSPTSWHNALRSDHGSLGCTPRVAHPGAAPSAWAPGTMTIALVIDAVNTPYGIAKDGRLHGYAQKKANHWGDGLGSGDVG